MKTNDHKLLSIEDGHKYNTRLTVETHRFKKDGKLYLSLLGDLEDGYDPDEFSELTFELNKEQAEKLITSLKNHFKIKG